MTENERKLIERASKWTIGTISLYMLFKLLEPLKYLLRNVI